MGLFDDLRYGIRVLVKNPGFTALTVLILALGIGANTAIFSVINAALLRPLPGIHDPASLVEFYRIQKTATFDNLSYPDYLDYRDRTHTLSGLAAHCTSPLSVTTEADGPGQRLRGDVVTGNYFGVLGVKPVLGRLLEPADDRAPHAVAVLSYGLWQRQFASDPKILGLTISLNGHPFTVIGIAAPEFTGTVTGDAYDIWVPISSVAQAIPRMSADILQSRSAGWLRLFGRLQPGVSAVQAQAEMKTIAGQLERAYPVTNQGRTVALVRDIGLYPEDRAELTGVLGLLFAAVAMLLLIACTNVAGLLTARASRRQREIAIRLAMGANRARLIRQLLTEGVLLSVLAGALGLLLAVWLAAPIAAMRLPIAPHGFKAGLDGRVLGFVLVASIATGILFALLPALRSLRFDLTTSLRSGAPGSGNQRAGLQRSLVIGQVAITFLLLAVAGLLLRNLYGILTADPGFYTRNLAMTSLDLPLQGYTETQGEAFYQRLLPRVSALPGIASASLTTMVPPREWSGAVSIFYPGQEPPPELLRGREMELGIRVDIYRVAPRYFATVGIPLAQGRDFSDRDDRAAPSVVIVSQRLAQRLWPGQNPIGKRISWPTMTSARRAPLEVVGVANDVRSRSLTSTVPLLMYVPLFQQYEGRAMVVVRTGFNPRNALAGIESEVHSIDKNVALYNPQTMGEHIAESLWQEQLAATWIGAFSLLALVLASVGLYAVIAQSVAQRTREIGIRMALGAAPGSLMGRVVREGMLLAATGLAISLLVMPAVNGLVRRFLSGFGGSAYATLAGMAALLGAVMLLACYLPARRASRVSPIEALRCD